ncbi:MAG: hypothetical protein JWN86_4380 [Planctomycetota bacterium]|nr:hypothetical protein [Planctomycetota bacterium]
MKRAWILALALGVFAPVGLIGCGDTEKEKVTVEKKGPEGSTTTSSETKTTKTGDGGAAPAAPK